MKCTVATSLGCEAKLPASCVTRPIITNSQSHQFPRPSLSARVFIPKHLTRKLLLECFHRLKPGIISSTSSPSVQRHRKICRDPETTWTTNVLQNVAGSHKSLLRHARIALIAFLLCYFHGRLKRIYLEQTKSRWRLPRKLLLCFWRK